MLCPSCGYDNIEGMDRCENCMTPLRALDIPRADAATGVVRSVMEDDLSDLPRQDALTVVESDDVNDVVRRMKERGVALVLDGRDFVGLFTEHDAVRALVGGGSVDASSIEDVMTREVMPLDETDSVASALSRMAISGLRFVPVAHADGSHTVISSAGLIAYLADKDW